MHNRASTHPLAKGLCLLLTAVLPAGFGLSAASLPRAHAAPGIIYVRADATRAEDGPSWEDAYADLWSALMAAESGGEVWVAAGTYRPTTGTDRTHADAALDLLAPGGRLVPGPTAGRRLRG